eukprot:gene17673-17719_t
MSAAGRKAATKDEEYEGSETEKSQRFGGRNYADLLLTQLNRAETTAYEMDNPNCPAIMWTLLPKLASTPNPKLTHW